MSSTVAERIHDELARQILRGDRPPGSTLPPVRRLATDFEVTVPTIQRVLERLAGAELVEARRGSGVKVLDPTRSSDLSLLPLWFDALRDQPDRAAGILADFLELRRVLAGHLARTAGDRLQAGAGDIAAAATALAQAATLDAVARADAALTGAVVAAAGNFAVAAVLRSVERLALEVPGVAEALYGDRAYHQGVIGQVVAVLATSPSPDAAATALDEVLAAWDARTVQQFRDGLSQES